MSINSINEKDLVPHFWHDLTVGDTDHLIRQFLLKYYNELVDKGYAYPIPLPKAQVNRDNQTKIDRVHLKKVISKRRKR